MNAMEQSYTGWQRSEIKDAMDAWLHDLAESLKGKLAVGEQTEMPSPDNWPEGAWDTLTVPEIEELAADCGLHLEMPMIIGPVVVD